jgi:hypothetical protein
MITSCWRWAASPAISAIPNGPKFAPGLKTLDDALAIRRNVLLAFERAENESDPVVRQRLMTIAVVGGGPTGVELAGAFAELSRHVLRRDFRLIDPTQARVVLIEATPRILSHLPERLSTSARRHLERLGVEVITSAPVKHLQQGRMELEGGLIIEAETMIWAAGVRAHPITENGWEPNWIARVESKCCRTSACPGHPEVFAIGDMALVLNAQGQTRARGFAGRHANGAARRQDRHSRTGPRAPTRPTADAPSTASDFTRVSLCGQRNHGDHRPIGGGGEDRAAGADRLPGVGRLAVRSPDLSHRLSTTGCRSSPMDVLLLDLQAGRPDHHRPGSGRGAMFPRPPRCMFRPCIDLHEIVGGSTGGPQFRWTWPYRFPTARIWRPRRDPPLASEHSQSPLPFRVAARAKVRLGQFRCHGIVADLSDPPYAQQGSARKHLRGIAVLSHDQIHELPEAHSRFVLFFKVGEQPRSSDCQ